MKYVLSLMLIFVSGCSTVTPLECYWYEKPPLTENDKDVLSRPAAEVIGANNTHAEEQC